MAKISICTICVFALGFTIGLFVDPKGSDTEIEDASSEVRRVDAGSSGKVSDSTSNPAKTAGSLAEEKAGSDPKQTMCVPSSLFTGVLQSAFFPSSSVLSPIALAKYGLTLKEAREFCDEAQKHIAKYHELEARHSRLVEKADGSRYFSIDAFPAESDQLFQRLEETVNDTFDPFGDDRGKVLMVQIASSPIFEDRGRFAKEIFFTEAVGSEGETVFQYNIEYDHTRDPTAPASWTLNDVSLMEVRHPGLMRLVSESQK